MELVTKIINNVFYVSLLFIIVSALVSLYMRSRSRDRCLCAFQGYKTVLEFKNGKLVWGVLRVYSSGIELLYFEPYHDFQGHIENSYIVYEKDLADVKALYRYHDELTEENIKRRKREIGRIYHPMFISIMWRKIRNFFNSFKDAILQTFGLAMKTVSQKTPSTSLLSHQQDITTTGIQLMGVGYAFDAILERYIGQYVVIEIKKNDIKEECYGILGEYTDKFLKIFNTVVEIPHQINVSEEISDEEKIVDIKIVERHVVVTNKKNYPLFLTAVRGETFEREIDIVIEEGQSAAFSLEEGEEQRSISVELKIPRSVDMIVPRSHAQVRHAGKREKHTIETLLGLNTIHAFHSFIRKENKIEQEKSGSYTAAS